MPRQGAGVAPVSMGRLSEIRAMNESWKLARSMRRKVMQNLAEHKDTADDKLALNISHELRARSGVQKSRLSNANKVHSFDKPIQLPKDFYTDEQREAFAAWKQQDHRRSKHVRPQASSNYFMRFMRSIRVPFIAKKSMPLVDPYNGDESVTDECHHNVQTQNLREAHHVRLHTAMQAVKRQAFDDFVKKKMEQEKREEEERKRVIHENELRDLKEEYEKNRFRAREWHKVEHPFVPAKSAKKLTVPATPKFSTFSWMKKSFGLEKKS